MPPIGPATREALDAVDVNPVILGAHRAVADDALVIRAS